ncbi:MAG: TIGR03985 family CRISPR-associated protein [Leptolyngbyaceae cyanobacterium bins.59]|nr:TIGR03985 family CRISPR-associated protein [Leptolyngbyaceae cyanobacterium bins.59]
MGVMRGFTYPPSPSVLHWLSAGQLANRLQRSVRLWALLKRLYDPEWNWAEVLPDPFTYPDLRDRLYAPQHGRSDVLRAEELMERCANPNCVCYKPTQAWILDSQTGQSEAKWLEEMSHLTGLSKEDLEAQLQMYPFATVHRTLRDDLKQLQKQGWLQPAGRGSYRCRSASQWPQPPANLQSGSPFASLSLPETWELLHALESISQIQPNLAPVIESLWSQVAGDGEQTPALEEPMRRIFLQLDYILSPETQDRVDDYQAQLESLWRTRDGGVVQFDYFLVREQRQVQVTVHPVCIHYLRRAKYLSAYGLDPSGQINWHNYRLDRITSKSLKVLAWGDPTIPQFLKELWRTGQLYTSESVEKQLKEAWGFNFYEPKHLLILRFSPDFARWYVEDTVRHETFKPITYKQLPALIRKVISDSQEREQLLALITQV